MQFHFILKSTLIPLNLLLYYLFLFGFFSGFTTHLCEVVYSCWEVTNSEHPQNRVEEMLLWRQKKTVLGNDAHFRIKTGLKILLSWRILDLAPPPVLLRLLQRSTFSSAHKNSNRTKWLATNENSNTPALTSTLSLRQNKNRAMTQLSYYSFDGHVSLHRV